MRAGSVFFLLALLATACGTKVAPTTYYKDAKPILAARCEGCHSPTGIGPFDLSSYDTAKLHADVIVGAAVSRRMPPWMPTPGLPLEHERRLSDQELATLQAWTAQGTLEGNVADAPKVTGSDVAGSIRVDAQVQMAAPYAPDLSLGNDDYRCFVLDPKLDFDTAVTGVDVRPGNAKMVHHVILYSVESDKFKDLQHL